MDMIISKNAKTIRLTDERWAHITEEHCELAGLRLEVLNTIEEPLKIFAGSLGKTQTQAGSCMAGQQNQTIPYSKKNPKIALNQLFGLITSFDPARFKRMFFE